MIASVLLGVCLVASGPVGPSQAGPEDVSAKARPGRVRYRGEWLEPDAVPARVRADADEAAALDEYHVRRDRTPDMPRAQMELANWCEHRGLKAESIAHLTAVTRLDPNDSHAWHRLGYKSIHNRWVSEAEYAVERAAAEEQRKAEHYWEPHLVALIRRLEGPEAGREAAERELAGITDPRAVPAIWQVLVKQRPARLDLAVRLLGQIDSPESSRRLAGLILADPQWEPDVDAQLGVSLVVARLLGDDRPRRAAPVTNAEREASPSHQALAILRHRDPRDYIGAMIDSMRGPVTVTMQRGTTSDTGTLHVETETQDLRRIYVSSRGRGFTPVPGGVSRVKRNLNSDYQHALDYQANVDIYNQKVSHALRELTGHTIYELDGDRVRDDWRAWWAEERGYSYNPEAPRHKRTVTSVVVATHSCFAAGTPVRTLLGMLPIEAIRPGDQVLAQDVTTGALGYEPVVAIYHNPPKPTLRIDLGDEEIVSTPIHRFWKAAYGWAMARDLRPGDTIRRLGGTAQVLSVTEEKVQPVFNLDVAQSRSFFVGASGALVHDNSLVDPVLHPFDAHAPAVASARAR